MAVPITRSAGRPRRPATSSPGTTATASSLSFDISAGSPAGNVVQGNRIGTVATGATALGNGGHGVAIDRGMDNTVGGTAAGARNLISGNQLSGVYFEIGARNEAAGNYIGTNAAGTAGLSNRRHGVEVLGGSLGHTIGGTAGGAGNLISGNLLDGVLLGVAPNGGNADNNLVQGNRIGTDATGAGGMGNGENGVVVAGAGNTIGGATAGAGNLISGNRNYGVFLAGNHATGNIVQGNRIGTDVTGTFALGNGAGVVLTGPNNTIGGIAAGAGNLISGNTDEGIDVESGGNQVLGNFIGTDAPAPQPSATAWGLSAASPTTTRLGALIRS